jgi:hypothetical protein
MNRFGRIAVIVATLGALGGCIVAPPPPPPPPPAYGYGYPPPPAYGYAYPPAYYSAPGYAYYPPPIEFGFGFGGHRRWR